MFIWVQSPAVTWRKFAAKLDALDFDLLLIGGDLIDSSSYDMADLTPLKGLSQPVLFVSGNHEYYVKDHGRLLSGLSDYEVVFLDNEASVFRDLHIVGISDNQSLETKKAAAADLIHPERFNLVHGAPAIALGPCPRQRSTSCCQAILTTVRCFLSTG